MSEGRSNKPSRASRAQLTWASRARLSLLRPLQLGKSEKRPVQKTEKAIATKCVEFAL